MIRILLLALLQEPAEEAATEHYRVVSTYRNKEYVRAAAEKLESGYATLARVLQLPADDTKPFTIHLYATRKEYQAKMDELNPNWVRTAPAIADEKTNEAHFQPHDAEGAPPSEGFIETLHHEAFHLYTHRHAAWINRAPRWMSEGVAEYAAELSLSKNAVAETLWFGSRVRFVQLQRARRSWLPLDDLLCPQRDLDSGRPFYPEAWLLVKYLSEKQAEGWRRFLKAQKDLPEKERCDARTRRILLEALGMTSAAIEEAWVAWMESLKPLPWRQLIGSGRLGKEEVESISEPDNQSILLWSDPSDAERYALSGEVRIEEAGGRQADFVFVPTWDVLQSNSWKVALDGKSSQVLIYVLKSGLWEQVSRMGVDAKKLPTGSWIPVEIAVAGRSVKVRMNGDVVLECTLADPGVEMRGISWGVGGFNSWTKFRSLRLVK